ncbi:hypothetical protein [Globicatella sanguinis]
MSGLKLRLSTCLRPTHLCGGGGQTKRKLFNFLLLVHSQSYCYLSNKNSINNRF